MLLNKIVSWNNLLVSTFLKIRIRTINKVSNFADQFLSLIVAQQNASTSTNYRLIYCFIDAATYSASYNCVTGNVVQLHCPKSMETILLVKD